MIQGEASRVSVSQIWKGLEKSPKQRDTEVRMVIVHVDLKFVSQPKKKRYGCQLAILGLDLSPDSLPGSMPKGSIAAINNQR